MRRDATVCPHCRRDSDAWRFWKGRWWSPTPADPPVWYDETARTWREASELPALTAETHDVVITAITDGTYGNLAKIARIISDTSREPVSEIIGNLHDLPATVVSRTSYSTAEGVRAAISRRRAEAVLQIS